MVEPMTIGADSCPRLTPVPKVHATFSCATFPVLISASELKRVLGPSFIAIGQSPSCASADAAKNRKNAKTYCMVQPTNRRNQPGRASENYRPLLLLRGPHSHSNAT